MGEIEKIMDNIMGTALSAHLEGDERWGYMLDDENPQHVYVNVEFVKHPPANRWLNMDFDVSLAELETQGETYIAEQIRDVIAEQSALFASNNPS